MRAFLTSYLFLVLALLIISIDHLIDGVFAHNYAKVVVYSLLSLALVIAFIALLQ